MGGEPYGRTREQENQSTKAGVVTVWGTAAWGVSVWGSEGVCRGREQNGRWHVW